MLIKIAMNLLSFLEAILFMMILGFAEECPLISVLCLVPFILIGLIINDFYVEEGE